MPPSESAALANASSSVSSAAARARPLLHCKALPLAPPNRKLRFTSVHASDNFLACGTNAGSVFLYATTVARGDGGGAPSGKYHLVKMITPPSNDRVGVACLSICPQQKHLVVGTLRGVVYGLQLADYNKIGEKVEFSHDFHAGFPVTCFLWDAAGTRLFSACNAGLVCQTVLRAGMSALFGSADTELLLKEDTGVVQLDLTKIGRADVLLVSSQLRVLLLNLTASGGSAVQIGTKARQGNYGACFFTQFDDDAIDPAKRRERRVFSSRPGRRVWIADPQTGTVSSTIKFSVLKGPSAFLQGTGCAVDDGIQPRDLTINKLSQFQFVQEPSVVSDEVRAKCTRLVSWNVGSSVLFFLDPIAVEVVEWHLDLGVIHDLKIMNDSALVVLHGEPPKVSTVQSCSARQFLDLYGGQDVKKSVQLAVEFNMNEASVLDALRAEWANATRDAPEDAQLAEALDALCENAKRLEEQHLSAHEIERSNSGAQPPLQVFFKHRPQAPTGTSDAAPSAVLSSSTLSGDSDKAVTLATGGGALHKRVEYFDALAPPHQTYSKSIYAPDGSAIEATMAEIGELHAPVVRDDYRAAFLTDVMAEVRRAEQSRSEEHLLPGLNLKGNSLAAAKALSTLLPSSSMLSSLMDPAAISQSLGVAHVASMFGEFPSADDAIVLDPDPRPLARAYPRAVATVADNGDDNNASHEYSVLRIAMSSAGGDVDDTNLDTEVLLEAISMDIWDSNLKYTSNLPLDQQFDLPESDTAATAAAATDRPKTIPYAQTRQYQLAEAAKRADTAVVVSPPSSSPPQQPRSPTTKSRADMIRDLKLQSPPARVHKPGGSERRATLPPSPALAAQRALHKFLGATPSCEVTRKCMVGGHLARSPELAPVLKREVVELAAELHSAAATAAKTKQLAQRLWPAAGITRVCACLTSLHLFEGDLSEVQATIERWLSCFDPTATPVAPGLSPSGARTTKASASGFARGEALVDGDGLPLTRGDWNLVRVMVSIYFAICAAGNKLHVRPASADAAADASGPRSKLHLVEMGVALDLEARFDWSDRDAESDADRDDTAVENRMLSTPRLWTARETEAFVAKYGAYLNPELAAEVCNLRLFSDALNLVLDRAVSSPELSAACDEIVNWVAENEPARALAALRERDSICVLLHLLDVLLKKCPDEAVDVCVAKYPVLYPWNVERSLFGAQIDWDAQAQSGGLLAPGTVAQTAKYFRYLARLLEAQGAVAGKDALVVNRCLQLSFAGDTVVGRFFDERDRGGRAAWVASIVRAPDTFRFDHAASWALFLQHELWSGLLELAVLSLKRDATRTRGLRELHELVALVATRKQWPALERVFQRVAQLEASAAVVDDVLRTVLRQLEARVAGDTHRRRDDSDALSTTAIYALLNAVPLPHGMRLLARCPLLFAATPLSMYHTIVENHVLTSLQMHEVGQLLEVVDTHVWSSYRDAAAASGVSLSPQAAAVVQLELGTLRPSLDDKSFAAWTAKCGQYEHEVREHQRVHAAARGTTMTTTTCATVDDGRALSQTKSSSALSGSVAAKRGLSCRSFEYRNSDWGGEVQLHDSSCAACELSVVIIADDNANLDVVLLPCGHAFHSTCLDDHACSICLDASLETLD
ncbi:hypothetical protein PybrP1_011358, partial [[Pythium] brassicae (nom. inval.)]